MVLITGVIGIASKAMATDPVDPQPASPNIEWEFSTFIKGDTAHVRDLINGQLEDVLNRKAFKLARRDDLTADIDRRFSAASAKLAETSPGYAAMQRKLTVEQDKLAAAREAHNSVEIIEAQNQISDDQAQLKKQVEAVFGSDSAVADDRRQISDLNVQLRQLEPAITSASKARDQLIEGIRISRRLPGPPKIGGRGILGKIKPTKIIDGHSFTCDFEAYEIVAELKDAKGPDGFKNYSAREYPIQLLVSGYDTSKVHTGSEAILDRVVEITGTKVIGRQSFYVVSEPQTLETKEQAFNMLFNALDNLRVPASVQ
jgi:hypothetical protein